MTRTLTDEQVLHYRKKYCAREITFTRAAAETGLSVVNIRKVILGYTYKHLNTPETVPEPRQVIPAQADMIMRDYKKLRNDFIRRMSREYGFTVGTIRLLLKKGEHHV